ncbi:ABC transporter permease subunit [Leadbettera azotonutricia]|uniref:ABC transporter permease subunit n=1 Tax=Leadbettera azotonutricia TaxID=150829 RepID=UPI001FE0B039|nr:ABC transporter permease subunit [Leadbettera azotonutricia]
MVFIVLFGFIVGYLISRFRFRGRKFIYTLFMMGMMVPMHALLIPIYILFSKSGLTNHWFTIAFPNVAFGLPMAIFLIESYIGTIPKKLEEAAIIDGPGFSMTMFTIIFPRMMTTMVIAMFPAILIYFFFQKNNPRDDVRSN